MSVIKVQNLAKKFRTKIKTPGLRGSFRALIQPEYREIEAVRGVDFEVERGEILAFIGPNGAGKSTTIKMLTGILYPTSGEIEVLGLNPARDRKRLSFQLGSVFGQKSQLWFHLPPLDSFRLLSGIFELPKTEFQKRLDYLVELFELEELLEIPVRKLSLGQRVRCELVASLIHQPELIFLDEPTIGLDIVVKQKIRDLILRLNREEKTTIFLTSHDAGDIEQLCQRTLIINHGTLVLNDTVKNLKYNYLNQKIISVKYRQAINLDLPGIVVLKEKENFDESSGNYGAKILVDTKKQQISEVTSLLMNLGEVIDLTISDQSLEEIIAKIYTTQRGGHREANT